MLLINNLLTKLKSFNKKIAFTIVFFAFVLLATIGLGVFNLKSDKLVIGSADSMSATGAGQNWLLVNSFTGWNTLFDPEKIDDGQNPQGQNTSINQGDRISIRPLGYDIFPSSSTLSTNNTPITSLHTFRKRSSENIMMRSEGTVLEWFDSTGGQWETLKTGLTDGKRFGYADLNINTELKSYVYFGNAYDPFMRWNGGHTNLTSAIVIGTTTIQAVSTDTFNDTGTIIYCGVTTTYSAKTDTTFTIPAATFNCDNGRGIAQAPDEYPSLYRGNIYLFADNRLWISGNTTTPELVVFSKYGDAQTYLTTSLVTASTGVNAGIFNLGEGGGAVTGLVMDENSVYIFKKSLIYKVSLTDDLYSITPLKSFDGKSQTVGSISTLSTFTGSNQVFFVTPDNQIMDLTRVEYVDYPQINSISNIIKTTVKDFNFTNSTGITYQDKLYLALRSSNEITSNDTVLVYDLKSNTWDSPIIGWNVADWAIYDDGTGEKLYWGDNSSPNVYLVNDTSIDYQYGITANWRSKQYIFGRPQSLKEIDGLFVEGYLTSNTKLNISLLCDDDGYTQKYTTEFDGTESSFIYNSTPFNLFGLHPFGYERFGSNADFTGLKKFRIYLYKQFVPMYCYSVQVEFASVNEGDNWQIENFGIKYRIAPQEEKPSLYRKFN